MINFLKSIFKLKNNKIKTINSVNTRLLEFIDKRKIENVTLFDVNETNLKQYPIFDLGENTVIYFEKEISNKTDEYIRNNFSNIKNEFLNRGRNFYYLPILIESIDFDILPTLKKSFPEFDIEFNDFIIDKLKKMVFDYNTVFQDFLSFTNYTGVITKGCISSNNGYTIVEHKESEKIEDFFNGYISNLQTKNGRNIIYYSLDKYNKNDETDKSDNSTYLNTIFESIEVLRKNGQLVILAPKIYDFLRKNIDSIIYNQTYPILITDDFKIIIPYCNNLEIKLSHLTKSIYLLFLSSKKPIEISQLYLHRDRLLKIYSQISHQNSYDKLKESIDDLIHNESDAIYVHFSRIKKEFSKHFSEYATLEYSITGYKGKEKKIKFNKEVIYMCNLFWVATLQLN